MSSSREIKQLQKAKSKAQISNHLKEEANICNQLGELLSRTGDYKAAIREHQQELALSEALKDVIGRAVAHRKIGECYAEMGNIEAALKHQHHHLDLARSVRDHAEEQRALATIGRTYLFCYESDQSKNSLKLAEDAFRKSLAIVDERLGGMVSEREISEMKARLFLNLGLVCDHLGEPKRCSEFIRRSVFIAERSQLLEDLYRANFNLGNIYFRNGQHSNSVRCLEQAKECSRKMKDKFAESECFHCIGKGCDPEESDGEEDEEEETDNTEPLEDSDVVLSDSDEDLEGYDKMGETPSDTLRHWQKMYSRELDKETRQECLITEKLLRKALSRGVPSAPAAAKPFDALQDSQLFDAENSEPLATTRGGCSYSQDWSRTARDSGVQPSSPKRRQSKPRHRARGTEAAVLYGVASSSSDDSDGSVSPLRPVHPRRTFLAAQSQKEITPEEPAAVPSSSRDGTREAPAPSVFGRDEYHSAIRGLGSSKTLQQSFAQPQFSSTPAASSISKSALVPEDEYLADDWLEDDLLEMQPKKKRRLRMERGEPRGEETASSSAARSQSKPSNSNSTCRDYSVNSSSSSWGVSQRKNGLLRPRQVKMSQMPGMVRLGRREVNRSHSPNVTSDEDMRPETPLQIPHQTTAQASAAPTPTSLPPPIRMRVRVQEDVFLIPVPQSEAESCTVSWLCDQAARRYYQKCGLLPRLSLQKEGALLSPQDLLLAVLQTNEEVLAEVCSWDLPPLPERYRKACESLAVEENKRVTRLCEVQDSSSSVSVCGLSLGPASLNPLLRAFKLQASLSELRVSGNRLSDDLLPELVAATTTMPHLRLLDVSANLITGDGLKRAVGALKGQSHPAFPCLEELNLSMNPLGDAVSESLSCLLSLCPLLSKLSLQACGLTARFLQQHRLLLASALKELGHLKSVSLSHNALGSTGFELVLRTLPLHSLTHLDLSAIRRGPTDHPALEHLTKVLSQEECSLTHLSLASNGLTDSSIIVLSRCLPLCPTLVSLNLSGNPSVTSVGLQSILMSMREASRPLTHLNLQGCQVSGPWDSYALDGLSTHVQELRLCSRSLNKLNRDALKQNWVKNHPDGCFLNQNSKFLLSAADSSR
uniref:NF-kappa-B inhibitor-like protein 2 n=1 Tax=Nothobranchius kadleci TaxID=1051664 RepID=A0A1A8BW02_NOTKA